ncbi:MAG: Unknown protein [uncultured Thiotrichaceae bacterium]|uniref:Uncharacterized protein n=1 Tax=uncultured Thiotrichaceae bacterium TaxID=298394 RepID=A0A6S6S603_9GAMM|nr:MAG: Unknown protein [uncultured Thiotrichaceae bacterium]
MIKKDIYKIDNLLITIGRILLVFSLLSTGCSMSTNSLTQDWASWVLPLSAAISLLVVGGLIRHKENQIIAIWNILEHSTEVSMQELMHNTGFERPFIQQALLLINRRGDAYYVWESKNDIIVDGRLRTTLLSVPQCSNCGGIINQTLTLDLNQRPSCPYCGKMVSTGQINQLKSEAIDKIRTAGARQEAKGFSIWIFIILFVVFWPAAVAYAVWKSETLQGLWGNR